MASDYPGGERGCVHLIRELLLRSQGTFALLKILIISDGGSFWKLIVRQGTGPKRHSLFHASGHSDVGSSPQAPVD
jgi:hypothetical protein